jgi:hypothetical protein
MLVASVSLAATRRLPCLLLAASHPATARTLRRSIGAGRRADSPVADGCRLRLSLQYVMVTSSIDASRSGVGEPRRATGLDSVSAYG